MNVIIIFWNFIYRQNKNISSCFLLENQVLYLPYNCEIVYVPKNMRL